MITPTGNDDHKSRFSSRDNLARNFIATTKSNMKNGVGGLVDRKTDIFLVVLNSSDGVLRSKLACIPTFRKLSDIFRIFPPNVFYKTPVVSEIRKTNWSPVTSRRLINSNDNYYLNVFNVSLRFRYAKTSLNSTQHAREYVPRVYPDWIRRNYCNARVI